MHSAESALELRQDFADDWTRTNGFRIPDPCPPLPSPNIISRDTQSIHEIVEAVAAVGGISPEAILGRRQHSWLVKYRTMAILIAHETLDKTTDELGRAFTRDHSTIVHSLKRAKMHMKSRTWRAEYHRARRAVG